jgi:phage tail sheath protein FI
MATYTTPGVYVKEIPARNKPIEGVSTSVAAFVGLAPGGPLNRAVKINDWSHFKRVYSNPAKPNQPFMEGAYLAHAVQGFFANQGPQCWVVRVGGEGLPQTPLPSTGTKSVTVLEASALEGVEEQVELELKLYEPPRGAAAGGDAGGAKGGNGAAGGAKEKAGATLYTLVVSSGTEHELYPKSTPGAQPANGKSEGLTAPDLASKVNAESKLIKLDVTNDDAKLELAPGKYPLSARSKEITKVTATELEGDLTQRTGLEGLDAIEDVSIVCVPDLVAIAKDDPNLLQDIQKMVIAHCEDMADRVALLDTPPGLSPDEALDWLNEVNYDAKQATLYYPWLEVKDPLSELPTLIPPCGHVAGVWARTDATRGVHKAPANEAILGINGLGFTTTDTEQGDLNRAGINCIRSFPGRGIRVWGARTLSSDAEWRYLNVRRLFNFISDSIRQGTQWAVFEPNDEHLWIQLQIAVSNFLTVSWREGALFGGTPDEAFYVKCDKETNPQVVIDAGQVVTEIGIAPVRPAEFVVFHISQYTAGGEGAG